MEGNKQLVIHASNYEHKTQDYTAILSFGLSIIGLAMILLLSYINEGLFFRELSISSMIILVPLSFKFMADSEIYT